MSSNEKESINEVDATLSDNKRLRVTAVDATTASSSSSLMDASTFLFKSPSNPCEIENFTTVMKDFLNSLLHKASEESLCAVTQPSVGYDTDEEENQRYSMEQKLVTNNLIQDVTNSDLDLSGSIVQGNPRSYQTALFELAKIQNTIVNLPTGAGKTLIALLCIKYFASDFECDLGENITINPGMEVKDVSDTTMADVDQSKNIQLHEKGRRKQTLFLVPSIALAIQHTATLRANLPYVVATACNQLARSTRAREELLKANIIVATHGAARNLFMHYGDMFKLQKMNLIVVDECHYAIGDHGYATLFKNFYHTIECIEHRPRILGLTASPLVNVRKDVDDQKLEEMLQELETILDAKVASFTSSPFHERDEDENGSKKRKSIDCVEKKHLTYHAIERVINYHSHKAGSQYPFLPSYENIGLHSSRIKEFRLLYELYACLGPKITAIYSKTLSFEVSRNRYDEETSEQFQIVRQHLLNIVSICDEICKEDKDAGRTEKIAVLEEILEMEIENNGTENAVGVVFVDRRITALALHNYFKEREKAMDQGLPWPRVSDSRWSRRSPNRQPLFKFASNYDDRRHEIEALLNLDTISSNITENDISKLEDNIIREIVFETLPEGINIQDLAFKEGDKPIYSSVSRRLKTIRSDMLVRQSNQIFKYLDKRHHLTKEEEEELHEEWLHDMKKSTEVLDGLRSRRTNVLVATSVVEEGVDVEACSFVVVFDHLKSTKGYVQMRGRARQQNARFYVFHDISPTSTTSYISLQDAYYIDRRLQTFIENRPTNVPVPKPPPKKKIFDDFSCDEYKAVIEGFYSVGHGTVDLTSARSLLNRYSLGINSELCCNSRESFTMKLPVFGENTLTLSSHLPGDVRQIDLPKEFHDRNKREKMNIMALMACVRLHKLKLLNDRLLPLHRRDIQKELLKLTMNDTDVKFAPLGTVHLNVDTSIEIFLYPLNVSGDSFDQYEKLLNGDGRKLCVVSTKQFPRTVSPMAFAHPELGTILYDLSHPTRKEITSDEWSHLVEFYVFVFNTRWGKRDGLTFFRFNIESRNWVQSPYLIGCLTHDGSFDWPRMAKNVNDYTRPTSERIEAARNYSESGPAEPRICCTIYDQFSVFIIMGATNLTSSAPFPKNERGFESYYQYMAEARHFKVSQDSRLFHGQRLWYLPRRSAHDFSDDYSFEKYEAQNIDTTLDATSTGSVLLPQDAIMETTYADASLYLHFIMLPQFLFLIDHNSAAQEFIGYALTNLPILGRRLQQISEISLDPIKEAITARSCGLGFNYDKLEWLGDAVLKLIHTDALLSSSVLQYWVKYLHEGDLSVLRAALGSNENLARVAKNTNIHRFICTKQLGKMQWSPNCLELMVKDESDDVKSFRNGEVIIGQKICADVVEALIGLIYFYFGYEAASDVALELGCSLLKGKRIDKSIPGYVANMRLVAMAKSTLNMNTIQLPELIEEALTHPSCLHEQVPSYQNLEWVGDAVLCLFARFWILQQFPHLHVSAMNLLEASLICNETLAYVCLRHGIHRYLNHRDPALPSRIEEVERALNSTGRGLWTTDPPKCLSDIVESLLGACYMDAGFEAGQKAAKYMLSPVLEALAREIGKDDSEIKRRMMHPKQSLHETAIFFQIKALTEEAFACLNMPCPIWRDHYWGTSCREGSGYVAVIQAFGFNVAAIHDKSAHVARNRACAICYHVLDQHLKPLLKEVKLLVSKNGESYYRMQ